MKEIKTKYFVKKCFAGLNFLAIGIWSYSIENDWNIWWVDAILGMIIVSYFVFDAFIIPKMRFEPEDEMTKQHEYRAQVATYSAFSVVLAVTGVLGLVSMSTGVFKLSFRLSWVHVFIVLGILQVVEYISFLLIEKSGDVIE